MHTQGAFIMEKARRRKILSLSGGERLFLLAGLLFLVSAFYMFFGGGYSVMYTAIAIYMLGLLLLLRS